MGTVLCSTIVSTHHPRTFLNPEYFFGSHSNNFINNISFDDGRRTTTIFGCNMNERVNWPPHLNLRRDENPTSRRSVSKAFPRGCDCLRCADGGPKGARQQPTPQHPAPGASFFFFFATWLTPEAQKSLFFVSFSQAVCPVCVGGPASASPYVRANTVQFREIFLPHASIVPSGISVCTPGSRRGRARGQRDLGVAFLPLLA
jgi:hypothetical protein